MRNLSRGSLAFTLVALLAAPALAQERRGGGGMGAPPGAQGLALWAAFDRNFDSLTTALAMDQGQKDGLDGVMAMMRMERRMRRP